MPPSAAPALFAALDLGTPNHVLGISLAFQCLTPITHITGPTNSSFETTHPTLRNVTFKLF
jgi:hypothetical protein